MSVWMEQITKRIYKTDELIHSLNSVKSGIVIIQGPSLCGKTMLVDSIKKTAFQDIKIYNYNEFVNLLRDNTSKLNEIATVNNSIICIEDLDFLQGKDFTQERIANAVNLLSETNLVIITGIQVLSRNNVMVKRLENAQVFSFVGDVTTGAFCDLHIHSDASDGSDSPEKLIEIAEALNLSAVALCDHNCIAGLERFINAAADKKVTAVPGIEITAGYNGKEVHILGLFIKPLYFEKIKNYVAVIHQYKEKSNIELTRRLNAAGIGISYAEIANKAEGLYINRVDFANAMVQSGYVESVDEAFKKYLDKEEFKIPTERLSAFEVIEFLRSVEALPVMAHPFLNLSYDELISFLPKAKENGLVGIETNYSTYTDGQTTAAIELAERFGLLKSGGSDYHGSNKKDIFMCIGKGSLAVPADYFEKMKAALS